MSPTGPRYPTSAVDGGGGATVWTNPGNAKALDGVYATNIWASPSSSNPLNLTGFGFSIPSTAIIDGVYMEMYRQGSAAADLTIKLLKAGVAVGTNKGVNGYPGIGTPAWATYGGPSDLWGTTLTPSDVNNANFGVTVSAINTHGGGEADIDAVRLTVYWHTAPTSVPKRYLYQVFTNAGQYLGLIPNVTSDYMVARDINSAGAQLTITAAINIDNAALPITTIDDETGSPIQTESGANLETQRAPDTVGNSSASNLIKNGNRIKVYEIGYYYPNGKLMFSGQINRWEANVGAPDGNDEVKILAYSDGADLNNLLLTGGGTTDQSQTAQNSSLLLYDTSSGKGLGWQMAGQTITSGQTTLEGINLMLTTGGLTDQITVSVYANPGSSVPLAQVTQTLNLSSPTVISFVFAPVLAEVVGSQFFITVSNSLANGVSATYIYYSNANPYSGGQMYTNQYSGGSGGGGWIASSGSDLYFVSQYGGNQTTIAYSSQDPSAMIIDMLNRYNQRGGLITGSSSTIPNTSLSVSYTFVEATILEGIQQAQLMAPSNWYWYVDLGTDTFYFNQPATTAKWTFTKGKHIGALNVIQSIENIANNIYFSGGNSGSGSNVYRQYTNQSSINSFGPRLNRLSDNRVTTYPVADAIGNPAVATQAQEQNLTQVTILDQTMDITLFNPGDTVGFNGFGNFVDALLLQIVRVEYHPESVTLTLGAVPFRQATELQAIVNGLTQQQTIANPSSPQ